MLSLHMHSYLGSRKIASEENCPPALILKLILNQTLTLTGVQFSSGEIFRTPVFIMQREITCLFKRSRLKRSCFVKNFI